MKLDQEKSILNLSVLDGKVDDYFENLNYVKKILFWGFELLARVLLLLV